MCARCSVDFVGINVEWLPLLALRLFVGGTVGPESCSLTPWLPGRAGVVDPLTLGQVPPTRFGKAVEVFAGCVIDEAVLLERAVGDEIANLLAEVRVLAVRDDLQFVSVRTHPRFQEHDEVRRRQPARALIEQLERRQHQVPFAVLTPGKPIRVARGDVRRP